MNTKKTVILRIVLIVVLLAIAALMFLIGRGHTVYFDNKSGEYNGQKYETPYKIEVSVDGERVAKLYDGERGMASTMGQNFSMIVEITEEKGGDSVAHAVSLTLPYNMDGIILNIPAMMAGLPADAYLSEFIIEPDLTEDEEAPTEDDMAIDGAEFGDF
ncbi:MAG: hypothetical protein IJT16_11975 [Lachnospiraceae bacterium]|nr:hypothetical protein [Lachnospiraceae bacterium]